MCEQEKVRSKSALHTEYGRSEFIGFDGRREEKLASIVLAKSGNVLRKIYCTDLGLDRVLFSS